MKQNNILNELQGSNAGMTVPEGFFESFNKKMAASLPEQPWENEQPMMLPKTRWQKIRPYVYLAAMFMGIWCMMKMFDLMKPSSLAVPDIENNNVIMTALNNDAYYYDVMAEGVSDNDLYDDLFEQGFDPETLTESEP